MDLNPEAMMPGANVLQTFKVEIISPLGGRLNKHWLVNYRNERFVLRRWSHWLQAADIDYEVRLLESISALGWPVAPVVEEPVMLDGYVWSLFPFLIGTPPPAIYSVAEQRARGRLLAQFHSDLSKLGEVQQRRNWRRCEEILDDPALDRLLIENETNRPEEVRILRWHLDKARERVTGLQLESRSDIVIHGDFAPWNLRFHEGRLTGILDFELAHRDHRVGDFALSWRGKYDEVVYGYDEVSPLEPEEWELLTPLWWAGLIEGACRHLAEGTRDDGWFIRKLLERSPLMGRDSAAYRSASGGL